MKDQIKKLVKLAEKYAAYAYEAMLDIGDWHDIDGYAIRIYLVDSTEWAIKFGRVEIQSFCKKIVMPYDSPEEYLDKVYAEAKEFYDNNIPKLIKEIRENSEKIKAARIATLEEELKELRGAKM